MLLPVGEDRSGPAPDFRGGLELSGFHGGPQPGAGEPGRGGRRLRLAGDVRVVQPDQGAVPVVELYHYAANPVVGVVLAAADDQEGVGVDVLERLVQGPQRAEGPSRARLVERCQPTRACRSQHEPHAHASSRPTGRGGVLGRCYYADSGRADSSVAASRSG